MTSSQRIIALLPLWESLWLCIIIQEAFSCRVNPTSCSPTWAHVLIKYHILITTLCYQSHTCQSRCIIVVPIHNDTWSGIFKHNYTMLGTLLLFKLLYAQKQLIIIMTMPLLYNMIIVLLQSSHDWSLGILQQDPIQKLQFTGSGLDFDTSVDPDLLCFFIPGS